MDLIEKICCLPALPHLSAHFSAFQYIWQTVQQVQGVQEQLRELVHCIAQILQSLDQEHRAARLLENDTSVPLEHIDRLLREISVFASKEATRSFLGSILAKDNRIAWIDEYHCKVTNLVQVSALCAVEQWHSRLADARKMDERALNTMLNNLEKDQNRLLEVLNLRGNDTTPIIICIQRRLDDGSDGDRERQFFRHVLRLLTSFTGQNVEIENWMITSYEVELGHRIGVGGFGEVYKAVWANTEVAVKILKTASGITPSSTAIRREIETWSAMRHTHILQFLGANEWDERPFIVMPYLQNGNARDYVRDHPDCDRLRIIHHASLGLVYLHEHKIIHGDLKALNVLIDNVGNAVLCDFGLSRVKAETTSRSMTVDGGTIVGSRNWMSPERLLGGTVKKPGDIYALGMTIYEIFAEEVPLGDVNYYDFIELVVKQDVRPERPDDEDAPFFSDAVWELAEKCWMKDARKRPTAKALSGTIFRIMENGAVVEGAATQMTPTQLPAPLTSAPSALPSLDSRSVGVTVPPRITRTQSPGQMPAILVPTVPVSLGSHPLLHQPTDTTVASALIEPTKPTCLTAYTPALVLRSHTDNVNSIFFSPDGSRIISGSSDCTVRIWDAEMGMEVQPPLEGQNAAVFCVSVSPDGRQIASGSFAGVVVVWDAQTGKKIADSFIGHTDQINSVRFSPDGHHIVSTSNDKTIIIWDAVTGQKAMDPFSGHADSVMTATFSPGGGRIVSGSFDRTVRVWNMPTRRLACKPLQHNGIPFLVAFSSDGKRVISADLAHTYCVWDAEIGAQLLGPSTSLLKGSLAGLCIESNRIAITPDGNWVANSSWSKDALSVSVWNSETGQPVLELQRTDPVWSVAFSPDGKRLALASNNATIEVYNWPPPDT